jgi:Flp pilus assembly protein TadD
VRIKIGVLLDGQGKTEEAAKAFQEAVNCLASCEGHDGRLEAAVLDIRKAAELCPKCVSVRVCLGSLLDRQGKTEDAARAFQEAIDTVPTDEISNQRDVAHAYYNLGRMRLVEGNTEEAVNCFRDALGILPEYAAAHVELGSLLEERGKVAEAAIHYKNVVRMIPRTAAGHLAAGRAYLALGGTAQAVQHFSKALAMKADLAQAHIGLGIAYSELGSFVEATREFHAAAVLKPDDPVVHRELGLALMNEGRVEEALTHFREVFRMRPASPQAMNNLAWVLATSPDPKFRNGPEAVELSEKAGKLAAEEEPNRLGTLAAAYAEVGRFDDAVRVCEKAHALALRSGLDELAKVLDDRLDLFRSKNPYREQLHSLLRPHGKVIADEIGIVPEEEFGKTPAAESVKVPGSGEAGATAEAGMARTGT